MRRKMVVVGCFLMLQVSIFSSGGNAFEFYPEPPAAFPEIPVAENEEAAAPVEEQPLMEYAGAGNPYEPFPPPAPPDLVLVHVSDILQIPIFAEWLLTMADVGARVFWSGRFSAN